MSLRLRGPWTLACVAALAGCWESDGFVRPVPHQPASHADVEGPLADRLPVDGKVDLQGLTAPVDIVRDAYGVVHIYAQSHEDAFRAQGYAVARDRAVQIESLRRSAHGRTAEILGAVSPETIDQDIVMRTLGLRAVAERELELMLPVVRPWVEAFADGVSQHFQEIREGRAPVPPAGPAFRPLHFEPFSAVDALLIDKLMQFAMSWSVGQELAASQLALAVRGAANSENPELQRRAGMLPDLLRFAPPRPATTLGDPSSPAAQSLWQARDLSSSSPGADRLASFAAPALDAWGSAALTFGSRGSVGSNAWAVDPTRSASGGSMLAADAHFRLTSPAPLWLVHIQISNDRGDEGPFVAGAALPGVPGVAYGFHRDLAWSPAASYFDVADVYVERLDPSATAVVFRDGLVPIVSRKETIGVADAADIVVDVRVVPHHGPVVPVLVNHQVAPLQPDVGALSVRWSGLEPMRDLEASLGMLAAKGAEHALSQVGFSPSSVRSFVVADRDEVLYVAPTLVPQRDDRASAWDAATYEGRLPCFALPGDGSAEWVGKLAPTTIPVLQRPASGYVVTANADPVGGTLDNDPSNDVASDGARAFFSCSFDAGFRQGRIEDRLKSAIEPLTLEEAASIQGDVRSDLASRLVPFLVDAVKRVRRERDEPGTFPLLSDLATSERFVSSSSDGWIALLDSWGAEAGFEMRTGVTSADLSLTVDARDALASRAALLVHAWLVRLLHGVFADEMEAVGLGMQGLFAVSEGLPIRSLLHLLETPAESLASYDVQLRESLLWDDLTTEKVESRDERLVTAWLDAMGWLGDHLGDDQDRWRWGLVHTVRLSPPDPTMGLLSIPPESDMTFPNGFPRPGGLFTVDTSAFSMTRADASEAPRFDFSEGAALRFAVRFANQGPEATVALAGGQIADPARAHFRDGVEYWRHNASHALLYRRDEVVNQARTREVAWSTKGESVD
jgi:penicillin amidase